jgi:1-acyl-sn-glycerol-3-phosphate acyltransferase
MLLMARQRVRYYDTYRDDFAQTAAQETQLPADYSWQAKAAVPSRIVTAIARNLGNWYCRLVLHQRIVGAEKLAEFAAGAYVYANHTQPVGDAFTPLIAGRGRHVQVLAAPANRGVPLIGRVLEYGGGLLVPNKLHQLGCFERALRAQVAAGALVTIYPEAHVWPYATMIRTFVPGSMHYPVATNSPVYTATRTYQRRSGRGKPLQTVYIDGPFWPNAAVSKHKAQRELMLQVRASMQWRAAQSNTCSYYEYRQRATQN